MIRFRQQDASLITLVDPLSNILQILVRLRQVFAAGALPFDQIRHSITPESIQSLIKPKSHHLQHGLSQLGIIIVEVRLVAEESMPVIPLRDGIPGPIGSLRVNKNDPGLLILFVTVAPDVEVAHGRLGRSSGLLKPGMLIGSVIEHEIRNHTDPPPMRFLKEGSEVFEGAVILEHRAIVRDIIAIVPQRGGEKWQQPEAGNS